MHLEQTVHKRDAEIARLRGELEGRDAPRWQAPRGGAPDDSIERWRSQLGQLDNEMRRELEKYGLDWGLPGRSFKRLPEVIELEPARGAFLGIEMRQSAGGIGVASVVRGSPAEKSGLKPGDFIVEIDGREVSTAYEVVRLVGSMRPGDALTVTVLRDDDILNLGVTLAAPSGQRWGLQVPGIRFRHFGREGRFGPGATTPDIGAEQDLIDVDVPISGGRSRVQLSAPGLFLSEQLATQLALSKRERRYVENALAEAREEFVDKLAEIVSKSRGKAETAVVARLRREAEAAARKLLVGKLSETKLAALEAAQVEAAPKSRVSVTVRRSAGAGNAGHAESGERRIENPLEKLFERAQEF
jgi:hypothetical protein